MQRLALGNIKKEGMNERADDDGLETMGGYLIWAKR